MHHGVEWAVKQNAGAQPRQGEEAVARHRAATAHLQDRLAQQVFLLDVEPFQTGDGPPHLGQFVGAGLTTFLPLAGHEHRLETLIEGVLQLQRSARRRRAAT